MSRRKTRDRTWFFLAKIWLQRGYLDKSQEALSYLSENLPDNLRREAQMLQSQIYIDSGQYERAHRLAGKLERQDRVGQLRQVQPGRRHGAQRQCRRC